MWWTILAGDDHGLAAGEGAVVGHEAKDVHSRHYIRGDQLPAKARALDAWETYLRDIGALGQKVIALRAVNQ